jgi:hypothetical protein
MNAHTAAQMVIIGATVGALLVSAALPVVAILKVLVVPAAIEVDVIVAPVPETVATEAVTVAPRTLLATPLWTSETVGAVLVPVTSEVTDTDREGVVAPIVAFPNLVGFAVASALDNAVVLLLAAVTAFTCAMVSVPDDVSILVTTSTSCVAKRLPPV